MESKNVLLLIIIIPILVLTSCKENITDVQEFPANLIDVNVGTIWTYLHIIDKTHISWTSRILLDTIFIFNDKSEKWYLYENVLGGLFFYFFTQRSDGIYHLNLLKEPYLVFKYPTKKNDTYITWYGDTVKVLSTNEVVNVAVGKLEKCIVYNFKNGTEDRDYVFKPGIGEIKFIQYKIENNQRVIDLSHELSYFTSAKPK